MYACTKGLWDAMNEYRFEDILGYQSKLSKSKNFRKICDAVKAKTDKHKYIETYLNLRSEPPIITISAYIKHLQPLRKNEPNELKK